MEDYNMAPPTDMQYKDNLRKDKLMILKKL